MFNSGQQMSDLSTWLWNSAQIN